MYKKNNLKVVLISITVLGFLLSGVVSWFLYAAKMNELYQYYRKEAGEFRESIYTDAALRLEVLYALSILYHEDSDPDFKRMDFEVKKLLTRHKEIHALAWVPKVNNVDKTKYINRHKEQFLGFEFVEQNSQKSLESVGNKKEYYPIYHISPLSENKSLFGLDLSSNTIISKSLNKAMTTGLAQASDTITIIKNNKKEKGFFIFLPIYTVVSSTVEERIKNLKGFVTGIYTYNEVYPHSKIEDEMDGVEFKIIDATSGKNELITTHNSQPIKELNTAMTYTRELHETLGRKLIMITTPRFDFIDSQKGFLHVIVFASGVLLTLSIVVYILIISRRTKLKNELEGRINEEVDKNQEKTNQLIQQSKLAQTGEMISMIAHQWRQPLTAITSTANTISLQVQLYDEISNEELLKEIELISEYSQHLSSTIDDFRNFYKPNLEKEDVNIEEVVDKTINIIHSSYDEKSIKLVKNYNCSEKLHIYPSQFSQVILNLLKNAEDVLVEKNIKDPKVIINTYKKNDSYILEINDNGGGIKEEHLNKIFDPYFSTKMKRDGTGLGLYMSKTIIEDHCNGTLEIENINGGALFRIIMKNNHLINKES